MTCCFFDFFNIYYKREGHSLIRVSSVGLQVTKKNVPATAISLTTTSDSFHVQSEDQLSMTILVE